MTVLVPRRSDERQNEQWRKLMLRLRQCADVDARGLGISEMHVRIVLRDGNLICWQRPEIRQMEPGYGDDTDDIVELLGTYAP